MKEENLLVTTIPTLANIIKKSREERNMTQSALAQATGLTPAEISRLENGITKKPSKNVLKKLSPLVGISYSQLLTYAGYSCIIEQEQFIDKKGSLIYTDKVLRDIYNADSDFLIILQDINTLSQKDISLLKNLILLMKQINNFPKDNIYLNTIVKEFENTKEFIAKQILNILSLV